MRRLVLILPVAALGCAAADGELLQPGDVTTGPDAGALDSGTPRDGGAVARDGGPTPEVGPSLFVEYEDLCDCKESRCCPEVTFELHPGDRAAHYYMCGDFVACTEPAIGWDVLGPAGWERVFSPAVGANGGFDCAPATFVNPWQNSVPFPPGGTVRAVAIFADDCSGSTTCTARCGAPYEVISNELYVPPETIVGG